MIKHLLASLCLVASLSAPGSVFAIPQDSTATTPARTPPSPEQVVNVLANKLALSDAQKNAITPIIADRQQKMKDLMSDSSPGRQRGRQMRQIMSDSDAKINAILTPDQQQKYAQLEQERREQRQHQKPADQS
jgi:Spy/CpxP family protein refolding chaperone